MNAALRLAIDRVCDAHLDFHRVLERPDDEKRAALLAAAGRLDRALAELQTHLDAEDVR